jgi:hypothetical protein
MNAKIITQAVQIMFRRFGQIATAKKQIVLDMGTARRNPAELSRVINRFKL